MIDVRLQLAVADGQRRFALDVAFASEAPVIALYGPSGAGKSLTLQAMAGLLQPAAGHVRIAGRTLYDQAAGIAVPAPQRRLGYLFQSYALFPHLTVRDNVAFGLTSWRRRLDAQGTQRGAGAVEQLWPGRAGRQQASPRCLAASSSVWPWRGRWPASLPHCCWTSPLPR